MYRVLALIVCAALVAVCGPLSGLHVHEYATHDHDDHQHAPAAHAHETAADHHHHDESNDADPDAAAGVHLEACDPGAHAVSFAFTGITAGAPQFALTVGLTFGAAVQPPPSRPSLLELSDVRAHSPPRLTGAPLRAPPLVIPA